mmetsp:Transcript_20703/g.56548  ORF Transcript_20703/g.56548 Transcript_20703/m.56548 type:complete len:290 (+) Transcript_20703:19-888(+)
MIAGGQQRKGNLLASGHHQSPPLEELPSCNAHLHLTSCHGTKVGAARPPALSRLQHLKAQALAGAGWRGRRVAAPAAPGFPAVPSAPRCPWLGAGSEPAASGCCESEGPCPHRATGPPPSSGCGATPPQGEGPPTGASRRSWHPAFQGASCMRPHSTGAPPTMDARRRSWRSAFWESSCMPRMRSSLSDSWRRRNSSRRLFPEHSSTSGSVNPASVDFVAPIPSCRMHIMSSIEVASPPGGAVVPRIIASNLPCRISDCVRSGSELLLGAPRLLMLRICLRTSLRMSHT